MGATGVTIRHIEIKSIEMGRSSGSCRGRGGGGKVDLRRGMGGDGRGVGGVVGVSGGRWV